MARSRGLLPSTGEVREAGPTLFVFRVPHRSQVRMPSGGTACSRVHSLLSPLKECVGVFHRSRAERTGRCGRKTQKPVNAKKNSSSSSGGGGRKGNSLARARRPLKPGSLQEKERGGGQKPHRRTVSGSESSSPKTKRSGHSKKDKSRRLSLALFFLFFSRLLLRLVAARLEGRLAPLLRAGGHSAPHGPS